MAARTRRLDFDKDPKSLSELVVAVGQMLWDVVGEIAREVGAEVAAKAVEVVNDKGREWCAELFEKLNISFLEAGVLFSPEMRVNGTASWTDAYEDIIDSERDVNAESGKKTGFYSSDEGGGLRSILVLLVKVGIVCLTAKIALTWYSP